MTLRTLFEYLIGRRAAINEVAGNRNSLLIGFLLCLSAGLARHYDNKYLVREPWYLLLPVGVSVLVSAILFLMFYLASSMNARRFLPGALRAYLSFLGLFWMTAPIAWLYAIPYARFLDEVSAAQASVWTLGLVSGWRILIVSRSVAVMMRRSFFFGFTEIAVPAFALFYVALMRARMPLIDLMGGTRVPPGLQPVVSAYMLVMFFGFFALVIGAIVWLVSLAIKSPNLTLENFSSQQTGANAGLRNLALIVIFGFLVILPVTQREQQLRHSVEKDMKSNHIDAALNTLTSHRRDQFPPYWTPPPHPEYGEGHENPNLLQIVRSLQSRQNVPEWVHAVYREKVELYLSNSDTGDPNRGELTSYSGPRTSLETR